MIEHKADCANYRYDWAMGDCGLSNDGALVSSVARSLFTEKTSYDDVSMKNGIRGGYWGDAEMGSRLWTIRNEKSVSQAMLRAKQYATEALEWLTRNGIAEKVEVETSYKKGGGIVLFIKIFQPGKTAKILSTQGNQTSQYQWVWEQLYDKTDT